ncbi:hypothetical protein A3F37_01430 [Candidatus Saccharibacteria bacterium RIFCSPHIGHO2_12_FULL_41_12]|nr:MAG: hypothetical protein A3F37_01430 [Candidatus Saccharibacteria bacterium RIFCSPHIGHO2_12_FULL_41_12]
MATILFLKWWYSSGWSWLFGEYRQKLTSISRNFSVSILLKTLFAPWKQLTTQATFRNFFQAMVDNTISRLIGFIIRFFVLIGALIAVTLLSVFFLFFVAIWVFIPPAIVVLPLLMLVVGGAGAR